MIPGSVVGHELGEAIRQVVPPWLVPVFVLITHLGNPAFFLVAFSLDYWVGDHERGAHAIATAVAGMALVIALKTYFDAARPPDDIAAIAASGYAFPSGHATVSTIGYGLLAYDLKFGSLRSRVSLATVMVVLVSLSRVVLGVHYVRDVAAGMVIGATFLAGAIWLTDHDPRPGFALAVAVGAVAFVVSGASPDGVAVLGTALGGAITWRLLDSVPRIESSLSAVTLVGFITPVLLGLGYASTELELPIPAVFVSSAVVMVGILVAPRFVDRIESRARDARSS